MSPPEGLFNPQGVEAHRLELPYQVLLECTLWGKGKYLHSFPADAVQKIHTLEQVKIDFYHVAALQSQRPNRGCVHCRERFVLSSCSQWGASVLLLVNVKCHGQCFWPSLIDKHFSVFIPTQSHGHLHLFPPWSQGTSISASHSCYALKMATVLD